MNFLKRLFGMADRADIATERVALALEGIADTFEEVHVRLRARFGLDATVEQEEPPALPEVVTAAEPARKNGRKRITA